jgi:wobble nucleotide-excising tRNase
MFRRIRSIDRSGVSSEYTWPQDVPPFEKRNLVYGWNYSGKTTLSRVFRSFEIRQPYRDFNSAGSASSWTTVPTQRATI